MFSSPDVDILERAIRASQTGCRTSCVGRIPLRFDPDAYIEVGAGGDQMRMRTVIKGEAKHHVLLVREEIAALAAAIEHFKTTSAYAEFRKSLAAEAALERETSNDEFR